jgi:hypothetical protein
MPSIIKFRSYSGFVGGHTGAPDIDFDRSADGFEMAKSARKKVVQDVRWLDVQFSDI